MDITVKLFAMYRTFVPEEDRDNFVVQLEENACVKDLVQRIDLPADEPKIIFVNGRISLETVTLAHDDVVSIFPYICGG